MQETLVPIVIMTGMFAMIFGIVYVRSRENMALIEKGLNPRVKDMRPRPYINLKWGLLMIGSGMGLLFAYIIDRTILSHNDKQESHTSITIGGHHNRGKSKFVVLPDTVHIIKDSAAAEQTTAENDSINNDGGDEEDHSIAEIKSGDTDNPAIYFALVAIGGGLGLVISYRIEKKEWLNKMDKNKED